VTVDIPTLEDAKAENLLRAGWQLGDMDPAWIEAFLRDTLPQHGPDVARIALQSIADILNNANAAEQDGLMAAVDQYTDEAVAYALKIARDEREMASYPRLKAVK
jgi:hypothetical protein